MQTLESAIAEARRVGSELHVAVGALIGQRPNRHTGRYPFGLAHAVLACLGDFSGATTELLDAVLVIIDGVYQWREPVPIVAPELAPDWSPRERGCECHFEVGDFPCPVHPDPEAATCAPSTCAPDCPAEIPDDGGPLVLYTATGNIIDLRDVGDSILIMTTIPDPQVSADEALKLARMLTIAAQQARKAGG
jgi:hypothetical protein